MIGMCAQRGKMISGEAHLRQSIERILFTPLGSCVMRPEFGSRIVELLGLALNGDTQLQLYGATAEALAKWEKRIKLTRVEFSKSSLGIATIKVSYDNLETGQSGIQEDFTREV